MLGEIERGATSPTITVLWKIADGLKVPFTTLIQEEAANFTLVREMDMEAFSEGNACTISSIFKYDPNKSFEIFHIVYNPGSTHESKGHNKGVGEYILVYEGELIIKVGINTFEVSKGDSLFFQGDDVHVYSNPGNTVAKAYSIVSYDKRNM